MSNDDRALTRKSSRSDIDAFVRKMSSLPRRSDPQRRGRIIFAMDATASRQPAWDRAVNLQAEMFDEAARLGGLEIQLCHFRGYHEFEASAWTTDAASLRRIMTGVICLAGNTQIERVLQHAAREASERKVDALIYVGDCVEEDADRLAHHAARLKLLGVPAFVFHEGSDPVAERAFRDMARLSGGAYCAFDAHSPQQLRDLLAAVAVYAAGGRAALADYSRRSGIVRQLTRQIDDGKK
ncbi:MAG: VWA domain-containing protein [Gammaproteobacteria bacterium]|jgi:hypothetical protein|nr:VWA domain-containing protein [Gammaproteobacteria bacterium]